VTLFGIALTLLRRELEGFRYHQVIHDLRAISATHLWLAVLLTAASYLVQTGYDFLAIRYLGRRLAYGRTALASFVGYALSNTVGHSLITGASVRYRLYTGWGLSAAEIATVVGFTGVTFWLGFLALAGAAFLLEPVAIPATLRMPPLSLQALGVLFLLAVAGYMLFSALRRRPVTFRTWELAPPGFRMAAAQIAVSALDWTVASSVLYALLPASAGVSFPHFVAVFLVANIVGMVSQVPGGLGVLDTVVVVLLAPTVPAATLLGSLVAFRVVYYLLPLLAAALLMGTHEVLRQRHRVARVGRFFGQWVPELTPNVLAFTTFVGGIILLVSGATPAVGSRLAVLRELLPLSVVEASHFAGSLAGAGLLLLARGLQRRLDAAWVLTCAVLAAGIPASLLKGGDWEEALALTVMLAALLPLRKRFYRRSSILTERFTAGWLVAIGLVLAGSLWLGLFSYKHVDYSHDLWWQFAFRANAPRFLRASVGAVSLAALFGLARLLRAAPRDPDLPSQPELDRAAVVVAERGETAANLVLLGDKHLLWSATGQGFLMYGVEGRSWVALGDPVASPDERADLAWEFRQLVDRHGGWTVFYEVPKENLDLYLDLGLTLLKLGEEARVDLASFSLDGAGRKWLRHTINKIEKDGHQFSIADQAEVVSLLPTMRAVSDAWLQEKGTREKGFSLGYFDEGYLSRFPAAMVQRDGELVAFANIWRGAGSEELSVDLMRSRPDAAPGLMDYLFARLMLWGKAEGFRWFNLGMAPLSGLESRALAPFWHRMGSLIFRHGEHFYNFQGLRQFKEKFDPQWAPRYLACPGGMALPRVLTNVAALVSRGLKGVVTR